MSVSSLPKMGAFREDKVEPGLALREDPNPGWMRGTLHALYDLLWMAVVPPMLLWVLIRSLRAPELRHMAFEKLGAGLPSLDRSSGRRRILVHGVSVGEVKGAQSLVIGLAKRFPEAEIIVSTTTNTGLTVARALFKEHRVVRFPADISFVVRRFLNRLNPDFVLLVELEIWPNFLRECNRRGRPVVVVNGRITDRSHTRYRVARKWLPQFNRISYFCVQSEEYARRFRALDVSPARILVTGNIKVDGLRTGVVDPGEELLRLLEPREGQLVLVAGSTHEPEERWLMETWRTFVPDLRLILVPRHPQRAAGIVSGVSTGTQGAALVPQRLTELRAGAEEPDPSRPVLVDTIGELERVYALADLVFVGGSLIPHGGQNMLEPAAQGKAVLFGPHVTNFTQEAALLLQAGACLQVPDSESLGRALADLVLDPKRRETMAKAGIEAVWAQRGATELTLQALEPLLETDSG